MRHDLWRITAASLLVSVALRADVVVDSFDDLKAWSPNRDGGHAPEIAHQKQGEIGSCLRLVYRNQTPKEWGNVRRALTIPADATGIRFWVRVNQAMPRAALHVWLFEADHDGYLVRVRPEGHELCELGKEWREAMVPFSAFRFQPRGNRKRRFLSIDRMLFGCNYGDFDVSIDELRLVREEIRAVPMPRTSDLKIDRTDKGSVAVLAEPTFERQPGHADPGRLRGLLADAGFGVTLLRAGDACDASVLTKRNFDVLVVPCAPFYPRAGREALLAYLREGGSFLSMGGYAFDELVEHSSKGWSKSNPAVTAADMDAQRGPQVGINTRFGLHGDTMRLDRRQIGVFDPSYLLRNVRSIRVVGREWSADVVADGFAAVAMTGSNSPVFPDVYARWTPLVECLDEFGRSRGAAGAMVHNFAGPYSNASWAFFGVTNQDLFDGRFAELSKLFVETVNRLARPCFLHGLTTDLACYRQGETVKMGVQVKGAPEGARVHFEIDGRRMASEGVGDRPVEATWAPGRFDRDFYHVRALLEVDGKTVDEMETGFVVWDEAILRSGPAVALDGNYLRFRDVPTFLCGANQTGMMWYSANEDPLVWHQDFEKMNDNGLNMLRILHFSPFARDESPQKRPFSSLHLKQRPLKTLRQTDAIVQLAQKHNVILFLTLHDWLPVELRDDELTAQREWAEFWSRRYRDVPGIMYDVQNEPRVSTPDREDIRKLASAWLDERYRGKDALPDLALSAKPTGWQDLKARDRDLFRTFLFDRWTKANVDGVRAGDPDALVTVGHLQHLTAADKLLGAKHLDFTNTHFYGSVQQYRQKLKMIDRRFEGKSLSLGEFGSRIAHDARTHGKIGDPAADSVQYYLAIGHYALGMGASFIANWDWKDFRDCVFPWGINHADLVSKPVLEAYRNMSLLFRLLQPKYRQPEVFLLVPDSHRFGAHTKELHDAILRSVEWLFDCNVPFGVINEWSLDRLPSSVRAMVWPLPYCPDDATFDRVRKFVEAGGSLCFTGDIRYCADRKPDRADRLDALGLGAAHASVPPFAKETTSLPREPIWGAAGKGRVCWIPYPMELRPTAPGSESYRGFLSKAGVASVSVTPSDGSIHAFHVPLHSGNAIVVYNDSSSRQEAKISGPPIRGALTLELDAGRPGMALLSARGEVIAVEAQGSVRLGDESVAQMTGHQAAASLDGRDLRESTELLLVPFGAGEVSLTRGAETQSLVAEVGELRAAKWHRLAPQAIASVRPLTVKISESSQLDLRLIAARSLLPNAQRALEELLNRQ